MLQIGLQQRPIKRLYNDLRMPVCRKLLRVDEKAVLQEAFCSLISFFLNKNLFHEKFIFDNRMISDSASCLFHVDIFNRQIWWFRRSAKEQKLENEKSDNYEWKCWQVEKLVDTKIFFNLFHHLTLALKRTCRKHTQRYSLVNANLFSYWIIKINGCRNSETQISLCRKKI